MLIPIKSRKEIRRSYNKIKQTLIKGCRKSFNTIGFQGDSADNSLVYWNEKLMFWVHFGASEPSGKSFWCCYGVENPFNKTGSLAITCEINFLHQNPDRVFAGVFVSDPSEKIYITHNGNVGGGKKGIGKIAFWNYIGSNQGVSISWPDGLESNALLLGNINDQRLQSKIANFVFTVREFKDSVDNPDTPPLKKAKKYSFSPEFFGEKTSYRITDRIRAVSNHGLVVKALRKVIEKKEMNYGNDQRDLFIYNKKGRIKFLFEIKTDLTTGSIYSAIGQLMFHGIKETNLPKLIMVLPGKPHPRTRDLLNKLKIRVLSYRFENKRVFFERINSCF